MVQTVAIQLLKRVCKSVKRFPFTEQKMNFRFTTSQVNVNMFAVNVRAILIY